MSQLTGNVLSETPKRNFKILSEEVWNERDGTYSFPVEIDSPLNQQYGREGNFTQSTPQYGESSYNSLCSSISLVTNFEESEARKARKREYNGDGNLFGMISEVLRNQKIMKSIVSDELETLRKEVKSLRKDVAKISNVKSKFDLSDELPKVDSNEVFLKNEELFMSTSKESLEFRSKNVSRLCKELKF